MRKYVNKIIVRNNNYKYLSSVFIMNNIGISDVVNMNKDSLITKVLNENTVDDLYLYFQEIVSGTDNDYFNWMYTVSDEFGLIVDRDGHVMMCHYQSEECQAIIDKLGWGYIECKKYIGQAWWYSDEEIINDFTQLSFMDFMTKYRGYLP